MRAAAEAGSSAAPRTARTTGSTAASTTSPNRIVQTFAWEDLPEVVSLETVWFEDLGNGTTRLHAQSLLASFEARDGWLASGMETGVNDGYAKLDALLAAGEV